MAGKLKGVIPATTPERLPERVAVDPGADVLGDFPFEQMRCAGRELDHLDAARDLALGIREHLAVLGGDHRGDPLLALLEESQKAVEHAGAAQGRGRRPLRERRARRADRLGHLLGAGERHPARLLAGRRIEDRCRAPAPAGNQPAIDEMLDLGRHAALPGFFRACPRQASFCLVERLLVGLAGGAHLAARRGLGHGHVPPGAALLGGHQRVGVDHDHVAALRRLGALQRQLQLADAGHLLRLGAERAGVTGEVDQTRVGHVVDVVEQVVEGRAAGRPLQPVDAAVAAVVEHHDRELLAPSMTAVASSEFSIR